MLSSAFIRAPGYGTRCSTVIRRDRHGWTHIQESTWNEVGRETGRVVESFQRRARGPTPIIQDLVVSPSRSKSA
jgi:uncharacterized protein with NRDE domain